MTSPDLPAPKERWHVGKEVPIVLVLTIVSGIITAAVSYARMGDRITHNTELIEEVNTQQTEEMAKVNTRLDGVENDTTNLAISLGELKAGQQYMQRTLDAIADQVGRQTP